MYKLVKRNNDNTLISCIATKDWCRVYSTDKFTEDSHGLFVFEDTEQAISFLFNYVGTNKTYLLNGYELWSVECEEETDHFMKNCSPNGTKIFKRVKLIDRINLKTNTLNRIHYTLFGF